MSGGDITEIMKLWAAKSIIDGGTGEAPFLDKKELYAAIDAISVGECPWTSFEVRYDGPIMESSPTWQRETYVIHTRDPQVVLRNLAGSAAFEGKWDYVPFEEFIAPHERRYCHLMSGHWAMKQAVCLFERS